MAITISEQTKNNTRQLPFAQHRSRFTEVPVTSMECIAPEEDRKLPVPVWFVHNETLFEFLTPESYGKIETRSGKNGEEVLYCRYETLLKLAKRHISFKLFVLTKDNIAFLRFVEKCKQATRQTTDVADQILQDSVEEVQYKAEKILGAIPDMNITEDVAEASRALVKEVVTSVMKQPKLVMLLTRILEMDGNYLAHATAVSMISAAIAKTMKMHVEHIATLSLGGLLHDIGNFKLPTRILDTEREDMNGDDAEILKTHTVLGQELLNDMSFSGLKIPQEVEVIAMQHHEKFNGCGYPNRKQGRQEEVGDRGIHLYARIVAIADRYVELIEQAKSSDNGITQAQILARMFRQDGSFDPNILATFKQIIKMEQA